jgi:hypothetical protein
MRAAILWALVAARQQPVARVLKALAKAGYDLAFLKDDLQVQMARRPRASAKLITIDCGAPPQVTPTAAA